MSLNKVSLRQIIDIKDERERSRVYSEWVKERVTIVTDKQMVIRPGLLTSDQKEFLVEHLAKECVKQLLNQNCIRVEQDGNYFSVRLVAIKDI